MDEFAARPPPSAMLSRNVVRPPSHDPLTRGLSLQPDPQAGIGALLRPETRITVIYLLLASLWIIGSDYLLECSADGRIPVLFLHTCKGINFVLTTAILLYLLLRRAYGGWRLAEERRMKVAGTARECFRNLSAKVEDLREEERLRISREIHDDLGQKLTGLKMQLRLLEEQLDGRGDRSLNPLLDALVDASATADEAIDSVRRIASGLRPLALDHLGLDAALREEAEQFSRRTGIPCRLDSGPMDEEIPPAARIAAFRIFQECLTNVARHARASRVDAACAVEHGVLRLTVRDDGVGMDPAVAARPESLGLLGMMERAAHAGGTLDFKGSAGNGTEVALTLPLTPSNRGVPPPTDENPHC